MGEATARYAPVSHPSGNSEAARFSVQAISPAFWIGIAGLLFAAALPLPYGFYSFLRIAVFAFSIAVTFAIYSETSRFTPWCAILLAIAALFNPLVPVHLSKSVWSVLDVMAGALFLLHLFLGRGLSKER